jgi:hypothetical protein
MNTLYNDSYKPSYSLTNKINQAYLGELDLVTPSTYDIESGDTLWGIAESQLGEGTNSSDIQNRVYQLMEANELSDPSALQSGQTIMADVGGVNVTDSTRTNYLNSDNSLNNTGDQSEFSYRGYFSNMEAEAWDSNSDLQNKVGEFYKKVDNLDRAVSSPYVINEDLPRSTAESGSLKVGASYVKDQQGVAAKRKVSLAYNSNIIDKSMSEKIGEFNGNDVKITADLTLKSGFEVGRKFDGERYVEANVSFKDRIALEYTHDEYENFLGETDIRTGSSVEAVAKISGYASESGVGVNGSLGWVASLFEVNAKHEFPEASNFLGSFQPTIELGLKAGSVGLRADAEFELKKNKYGEIESSGKAKISAAALVGVNAGLSYKLQMNSLPEMWNKLNEK